MSTQALTELRNLSEKIARELVFAEAGKDLGLLPVNSLLGRMEELVATEGLPEPLPQAARLARRWVDEILETTGAFSAASLKRLGEWAAWWQAALQRCETRTAPAPIPADWEQAEIEPVPTTPAAATPPSPSLEEPVLVLNLEEDGELLREFINESREHLQNIEQGVLVLEANPADAKTLDSIFRAFHTLKGCSGFLNLAAIQGLAHELESLLHQARQHKLALTPAVINLILEGGDTLKHFADEITAQLAGRRAPGPIKVPTLRLLASIRAALGGDFAAATTEGAPGEKAAVSTARTDSNSGASVIKVDTLKLDSLVDLVGEMVIAQSLVVQNRDLTTLQSEQLTRDLAQLGRITKDLQRTALSLRMVPIGATFQKMNRLVRDLAAKSGKEVELVTEGEDTELDRTIVDEISDPLIHMICNSVDHGIEKPEARQQRGKPATGTVWLKAFHQGGNIVIEIKDDGHGLDRMCILAKAEQRGLVKAGEPLTESQVFNFILEAGFSTAEKVTGLSGRGVGMDVVRRNIEKLRGKLEIQSAAGQGTTFRIHLPLTLAIIDGLLVGVGSHRYILPTLLVRESFRPTAAMISTLHGRGEIINVRGRLCPLLRLYEHLGVEPVSTLATESIVVVVETGSEARCVLVDKLIGQQEVVIKSLGETFRRNRCVAGAAILGDGGVCLILDPQTLVRLESTPMEAAA
jgi:two-component system chemotaxis sensor kinase CheA